MEKTKDLTAGQAYDAILNGKKVIGGGGRIYDLDLVRVANMSLRAFSESGPFRLADPQPRSMAEPGQKEYEPMKQMRLREQYHGPIGAEESGGHLEHCINVITDDQRCGDAYELRVAIQKEIARAIASHNKNTPHIVDDVWLKKTIRDEATRIAHELIIGHCQGEHKIMRGEISREMRIIAREVVEEYTKQADSLRYTAPELIDAKVQSFQKGWSVPGPRSVSGAWPNEVAAKCNGAWTKEHGFGDAESPSERPARYERGDADSPEEKVK